MRLDKATKAAVFGDLLPRPQQVTPQTADLALSAEMRIRVVAPAGQEATFAGQRLSDLLQEETGLRLSVVAETGAGYALRLGEAEAPEASALGEEGYALRVDGAGAAVRANSARGLLWGAMTLRQLAARGPEGPTLAGADIRDWPHYRWRGLMVDAGRSPNSLAQIKRIVRVCSAFKLNALIYREGDDELNSVRYRTNKLGSLNPCALSVAQVRELVAYARQHGIAIVPEIESLGHSTAKGFHYPHLVSGGFEQPYTGLAPHIRKSHLNPHDPRSYELLASIYDEWFPILPSPLVHLGLDEVRLGQEEQAAHLARLLPLVDEVAARHGVSVTPIVWADAPPTPAAYASRVVRCLWSYAERTVSVEDEHLLRQGMVELGLAGCPQPVLMAGGSNALHTPYTRSPYEKVLENLADWARWGADKPNVLGLIAVQWSGNMLDDWLPDFLAAADDGWRPPEEGPVYEGQMARVRRHLGRLTDAARPRPEEVDHHAWDGIWLRDGAWYEDIMSGMRRVQTEA